MRRQKKLKVPFKKTVCAPARKNRLRRDVERVNKLALREDYELHQKRLDFQIELMTRCYKLSSQAVQYLRHHYGTFPMRHLIGYSEMDFREWLKNSHTANLETMQSGARQITWQSRLVTIAAFLLPKETREEWLGDLQESIQELIYRGYPRWLRIVVTSGRICLLCYALVWIKLRDLVSPGKRRRM